MYVDRHHCLRRLRDLPLETVIHEHVEGSHIHGRRTYMYISVQLNLSSKTSCLERPHFYGQQGGLSRRALLDLHHIVHIIQIV